MKELDDDLRDALRREPAPPGFAERVLRHAEEQARRQDVDRPRLQSLGWRRPIVGWAIAASLVAAVAGGVQYRNFERAREERAAGEAAREDVIKALRITATKLQIVQAKVREVGS